MKKYLKFSVLFYMLFACTSDVIEKEKPVIKDEVTVQKGVTKITFKGLKVMHRYKTSLAHLKERSTATKPGKVELALLEYSGEAIVKVADELYKNYPFPSKHNNFKTDMR